MVAEVVDDARAHINAFVLSGHISFVCALAYRVTSLNLGFLVPQRPQRDLYLFGKYELAAIHRGELPVSFR